MLLIQTISNEVSTDKVLDWICHLYPNTIIERLNDAVEIEKISVEVSAREERLRLSSADGTIDSTKLDGYWYRRGNFSLDKMLNGSLYGQLGGRAKKYIERELGYLLNSIDTILQDNVSSLNKPIDNYVSKIDNLRMAKKAGLAIPATLITNEIDRLEPFIAAHGQVILKPIMFSSFLGVDEDGNEVGIVSNNTLLTVNDIPELKAQFGARQFVPSLFQAYTDKTLEIRSFFISGAFYSMAIFSQASEKTKIDFRNYDYEKPNRCVPFRLPEDIERKLRIFMRSVDLNCGSMDIILDQNGKYFFLEVNPIGQYDWLSHHCNYFLDKIIAQTLVEHKK